jgi:hypothetical protein
MRILGDRDFEMNFASQGLYSAATLREALTMPYRILSSHEAAAKLMGE